MTSLIKTVLFWNKTKSDEELYDQWTKSNKTPEDFNTSIIQMKSNSKVIFAEISQVKLKTINDIKNLVSFVNKNQPTTTSSTRKNKLVYIIDNLQFIIRLYTITNLDSLMYFAFANKYDIFSLIIQHIGKQPSLQPIVYEVYYKREIYIEMVQYYLLNNSNKELQILLPNEVNCNELVKMNSIPSLSDIKKLFKDNYKQSISSLSELWFNIILHFNNTNNSLFTTLSKYIPNNIEPIELISDLYSIYNEITKSDFLSFISKPIELQFNDIYKIEAKEKYFQISNRLLSFINKNKGVIDKIDLIPYNVLKSIIENKSLYDQIIYFIEILFKEGIYKPSELKLFILKYLIENYSDDLMSSKQLVSLLKKIDSSIMKLGKICNEIDEAVQFISILNKEKITFTLVDLMKTDLIKADTLITLTMEFLMKNSNEVNQFDFIDTNMKDIDILLKYINSHNHSSKEVFTIGSLLSLLIDFYPLMKKNVLNVILYNKSLQLSKEEMNDLVKKFLPIADDIKNKQTIINFLPLISNVDIYEDIHKELSQILKFISIKEVFNTYQISTSFLEENYRNIQQEEIVEIYLIKTFDVDQINSVEDFIQKRPVKDIQTALQLNQGNFLFMLFHFFHKFNRETLYTQVLNLIKTDTNSFIDCIKIIKREKSKEDFVKFIDKNNLKTYLLDNSKYFTLFYNEEMFEKKQTIKFSTSKDNLDLLSILAIEKLGLPPKVTPSDKTLRKRDFINEDYTKEKEVIEEYYANNSNDYSLESLIKLYTEKKIQVETEVNYKYSLHPKLIELLNKQDYSYLIKNVKIDFGSKIKLYKFLIINNIIAIEHVFVYENLSSDKITSIDSIKILFNLYDSRTQSQIDIFVKGKIDIEQNQINQLVNQLIQINLTTIKRFTYYNLLFLSKYLSFDFESKATLSILTMPLMKIIGDICPRFNLLPFLSNFISEIYPNNINIFKRYYNDYCPLMNLNFFIEQTDHQKKFQYIEIYKSITLNNWINFIKIFNDIGQMEVNVLLIFVLKLIYNYSNTCGVMIEHAKTGCIYLMNLLNTFKLSIEEIKIVLNELYAYPKLTSILEGNQNILMLNQKVSKNIKCYSSSKLLLANEIMNLYPKLLDYPIYVHKNTIFRIKNCIIKLISDNDTKEIYNAIKDMNDFKELNLAVKQYPQIQNEIYTIYTNN